MKWCFSRAIPVLVLLALPATSGADEFRAGVSREDITPAEPIRLTGYAARKGESDGVAQRLWAKALAIAAGNEPPVVLITVDNCGICAPITEEVARRLGEKAGVTRERLAICSTHTHSAPMARGFAPNIFAADIPADQLERIDRYSDRLIEQLERVALAAIADLKPARLEWNEGRVGFAKNRRTEGGPVDQSLPVLCIRAGDGGVRAIVANYACHCTTLGGDFNKTHGDWAGSAQEALEQAFPGAVALVTIGCGADANPHPRGKVELAEKHGAELAREAAGIAGNRMRPITAAPQCRINRINLPFAPRPTTDEWRERSLNQGIIGYLARKKLRLLEGGQSLPESLPYVVQSWNFGDQLALVFLAGEVVVDYALRLKENFDAERLWITAYANDVPCYIPSKRILAEGGYEAESSLWYYDRATRLAPETEDIIHEQLSALVPPAFRADPAKAAHPPPRSPSESHASLRVGGGLEIELVAAEPVVTDPIAVDWDARGALWVLELGDYPRGLDGKGKAAGRIKRLEDRDGDGKFESATLWHDNLKFPTAIFCWDDGLFICAAPDILFARDTDGDGRADKIEKRFSGFPTENFNARVNGLSLGLDNWIYGAGGLLGGVIEPGHVSISGRDFRFHPKTGSFEPATGLTQQGRVRDDWGNWFGSDNTNLLWHYPFPDHYARRNSRVINPASKIHVASDPDPNRLFPTSRTLERFNDFHLANRTTSACGVAIYRDDWLGAEYYGNAFTCEAVHNLVRRQILETNGVTFRGLRAPDEQQREFVSSRDNWTRFVQARTGPDGALWLVDMYRYVIEHPTWIPEETQKKLNLRAGDDRGRIYRLRTRGKPLRRVPDLTTLDPVALAAAFDTRNGTERDRVHAELLRRGEAGRPARQPLAELARRSDWPATRLHALCVLDGLDALAADDVTEALRDTDPRVRREAVRLAERFEISLATFTGDPSPAVRFQTALSSRASDVLGRLVVENLDDKWIRAAALSSAADHAAELLPLVLAVPDSDGRTDLITGLVASAAEPRSFLPKLLPATGKPPAQWQMRILADLLGRKAIKSSDVASAIDETRKLAAGGDADALRLVARGGADLKWLLGFVGSALEESAFDEIARRDDDAVPRELLARWTAQPPATRAKILRTLLARDRWHTALIDAVKARVISPAEIPANDQQRLIRKNENARELFVIAQAVPLEVKLKAYADVASRRTDTAAGLRVFERACATCHVLDGIGFAVGPDLAAFRTKGVPDFLTAILAPSLAIEPAFVAYDVHTRDGRARAGIVRDETSTGLTVVQPGGAVESLLRDDVTDMTPLPVSLMPEGVEQSISAQDMADLIAWFRRPAPPAFGSAPPDQAAKARADFLKREPNGLARVIFAGGREDYPGWLGRLPMHFCRQFEGANRLAWETAPAPADFSGREHVEFKLAAATGFQSQPAGKFRLAVNGRAAIEFDVTLTDRTWKNDGNGASASYDVREANNEDSCGLFTLRIPTKFLRPGQPATIEVIGSLSNSQRWFGVYVP